MPPRPIHDATIHNETIHNETAALARGWHAVAMAAEIGADALFKGTQVDGVYSDDPKKNPAAERYEHISHAEVLKRDLSIMDTAAIALARENHIPIIVFSIHEKGGFGDILRGGGHCTVVKDG